MTSKFYRACKQEVKEMKPFIMEQYQHILLLITPVLQLDAAHFKGISYSYITAGVGYLCYYTESEAEPRTSVNNKDILRLL